MDMSDDSTEPRQTGKLPPQSKFTLQVLGAICILVPLAYVLAGDSFLPFLALLPLGCVVLPVMWLGAELNGWGKWWRILFGLASVACVVLVWNWSNKVALSYERSCQRAAMEELGRLLDDNQEEAARKAVLKYNQAVAEGGDTPAATQAMLESLDVRVDPKG
jgi:hypothetical protein